MNRCDGVSYYEEECSSTCSGVDVTSIFECTDTGCSCSELLCDGLSVGDNITTCSSGQTYFADKCTSSAGSVDIIDYPPTTPATILCDGTDCINNNTFMDNIEINCSGSNDSEDDDITYFVYAKYNQTSESEEIINSFNNSLTAENLSFTSEVDYTEEETENLKGMVC